MRLAPLLFAPALLLAVVGEEWTGESAPKRVDTRPEPLAEDPPAAPVSQLPLRTRR